MAALAGVFFSPAQVQSREFRIRCRTDTKRNAKKRMIRKLTCEVRVRQASASPEDEAWDSAVRSAKKFM